MARDLDPQRVDSPAWTFALVLLGLAIAKGSSMLLPDEVIQPWEEAWSLRDALGPIMGIVGGIGMLLFALSHRLRDKQSRAYMWLRRVARLFAWAGGLGFLWGLNQPTVW